MISTDVSAFSLPPAIVHGLKNRYAEPHRRYHTWAHIEHLLAEFEVAQALVVHKAAVICAIYFHDAIYDVASATNEEDSAQLLTTQMRFHLDGGTLELAGKLVRATKTHAVSDDLSEDQRADCKLFLDMDMSILAAPREAYLGYANDIRQEYAVFPDAQYRAGRMAILSGFLARDRIFLSDHYFAKREDAGRENIQYELEILRSQ